MSRTVLLGTISSVYHDWVPYPVGCLISHCQKNPKIKKPKNPNTLFGLPPKSYTDQDFWDKECETVLNNGWLFVGFVHELKNPGDVVPITIANKPVLLLKNDNNKVVAFHNVCSHRCLKLIDDKKNVGKIIRCLKSS